MRAAGMDHLGIDLAMDLPMDLPRWSRRRLSAHLAMDLHTLSRDLPEIHGSVRRESRDHPGSSGLQARDRTRRQLVHMYWCAGGGAGGSPDRRWRFVEMHCAQRYSTLAHLWFELMVWLVPAARRVRSRCMEIAW